MAEDRTEQEEKREESPAAEGAKSDFAKLTKAELKSMCEALTTENEALKKETEQAKKIALQAADFQTLYTRLKADFDNYRRRNAGISEKAKEDATVALAEGLLPVLDNFSRALSAITDENTLVGIRMIFTQFNEILEHMNIRKFESLGADFDHNLHDAVLMQESGPENDGKVINVLLDGYRCGDRVIRAAKVIVGKCEKDGDASASKEQQ